MAVLQIIYAPNEIFRKKALVVTEINDDIKKNVRDMLDTLAFERAVGLGANMVGLLKRIIVVDLNENGISKPMVFINPKITFKSEEMQECEEASLSYRGISAVISRPKKIALNYLDISGVESNIEAEDFLAQVIQHEIDYLDGKVYLDYLSKMKRDLLLKKMEKFVKLNPPHVHGEHCHH